MCENPTETDVRVVKRPRLDNTEVQYGPQEFLEYRFHQIMSGTGPTNAELAELDGIIVRHPELLMHSPHDNPGYTPLHSACSKGFSYDVIEVLVRRNPDVLWIAADRNGYIPLYHVVDLIFDERNEHYTAYINNRMSIIKLMINIFPRSVEYKNDDGDTFLHYVCQVEYPDIPVIEFFKDHYAQSFQIKNKCGETPLHTACSYNCKKLAVIQLLYAAFPLAARWRDDDGYLPLDGACIYATSKIVEYLAVECWPVACLFQSTKSDDLAEAKSKHANVLEPVGREAICALVDVLCFNFSKRVLSKSDRLNFDINMIRSLFSDELQSDMLELEEDGFDELREQLDNVIRMNRTGRLYITKDLGNKREGIKVLQAARRLSAYFFHLRENPVLCLR